MLDFSGNPVDDSGSIRFDHFHPFSIAPVPINQVIESQLAIGARPVCVQIRFFLIFEAF